MSDAHDFDFEEFFGLAMDMMCVLDLDGRIQAANAAWGEQLGYTRSELVGRSLFDLLRADDVGAAREALRSLQNGERGVVISFETRAVPRDGPPRRLSWRARCPDETKRVYAIARDISELEGVRTMITEPRQSEEALRRSEAKRAMLIEQTPLAVIEWDIDFRVVSWNPSATRIFGYTQEEALGRSGLDLIMPDHIKPFIDQGWKRLVSTLEGVHFINENVTRDGRLIFCDWHHTPLVSESGEVIGVFSMASDVTEQKELEDKLRRTETEQRELIEQLSTPIIDVWDGVLAMPIIGPMDEVRTTRMTEVLLEAIARTRAVYAILDVTGSMSEAMDAQAAASLVQLITGTRLLGSQCLISGISPQMARTLTELDVDLSALVTFGTLQAALRYALSRSSVPKLMR